jgi:hypothetical protein
MLTSDLYKHITIKNLFFWSNKATLIQMTEFQEVTQQRTHFLLLLLSTQHNTIQQ